MKICGRKGQGHFLTFDPGTTIILQIQTFPQKPINLASGTTVLTRSSNDDLDLFYGKIKHGKIQENKISCKVFKLFAQKCTNDDIRLTLKF